jgi:hypothetical protein
MEPSERYRGALLGLAAGDALGTTLEFKRPGSFAPITDMVGGGPVDLQPGQWTDDTSMALCLAEGREPDRAQGLRPGGSTHPVLPVVPGQGIFWNARKDQRSLPRGEEERAEHPVSG